MAATSKLTFRQVETLAKRRVAKPAVYADGGGLYLRVRPNGTASWIFVSQVAGRRREMGLGAIGTVSLANARELCADARTAIFEGRDPFVERAAARTPTPPPEIRTFGAFADKVVGDLKPGWENPVHIRQWENTFTIHAAELRPLALEEVTTEKVLSVLRPLWATHQETASRVRGRIERVLDAARATGLIDGPWENPARWRGHLSVLLPPRRKLTARGHQAAMAFEAVPAFMASLRARTGIAARALELTILCATRTNETLQASCSEFDLERSVWAVSAARTKMRKEHRIPLSEQAVNVIRPLIESAPPDRFLFESEVPGKPLSNMAMLALLRRMKLGDLTVHGFRSSFRDWAGECTDHSEAVAEAALAHSAGNSTVRAYRRGDAFEKRRALMVDWADYCST